MNQSQAGYALTGNKFLLIGSRLGALYAGIGSFLFGLADSLLGVAQRQLPVPWNIGGLMLFTVSALFSTMLVFVCSILFSIGAGIFIARLLLGKAKEQELTKLQASRPGLLVGALAGIPTAALMIGLILAHTLSLYPLPGLRATLTDILRVRSVSISLVLVMTSLIGANVARQLAALMRPSDSAHE